MQVVICGGPDRSQGLRMAIEKARRSGTEIIVTNEARERDDAKMWPDMFRSFYKSSTMDMPDIFAPNSNPHQKRSRNHIGDYTPPKQKMSKHRKRIKGGLTK